MNASILGAGAPAPLTAMPLGVLVVDDQVAVREGLARLISCANIPLRGIMTAANGIEALRAVAQMHPEVIVLDVAAARRVGDVDLELGDAAEWQ